VKNLEAQIYNLEVHLGVIGHLATKIENDP
jgi:hypothetical protein